jgi:hypothetical protein
LARRRQVKGEREDAQEEGKKKRKEMGNLKMDWKKAEK